VKWNLTRRDWKFSLFWKKNENTASCWITDFHSFRVKFTFLKWDSFQKREISIPFWRIIYNTRIDGTSLQKSLEQKWPYFHFFFKTKFSVSSRFHSTKFREYIINISKYITNNRGYINHICCNLHFAYNAF